MKMGPQKIHDDATEDASTSGFTTLWDGHYYVVP